MKFLQKERSFSCRRYCGQEIWGRKSYSRWLSTQTTVMPAASDWNENELVSSRGVSISWLPSKATKVSAPFGARKATTTRTTRDRKSTRLNSSHLVISYAVFCLKKK